jgi:hypothetical protein
MQEGYPSCTWIPETVSPENCFKLQIVRRGSFVVRVCLGPNFKKILKITPKLETA